MDKYDQLEKLKKLLDDGAISQEEYEEEKAEILDGPILGEGSFWGMDENVFCMLLHLSQLLGLVIPFGGLVLPIVMWASEKDNSEAVDRHGRIVLNWVVSSFIYLVICFILIFLIIGIPLLIALAVTNIVFIIMGAVKANNNIYWEYPLSIPFFTRV